MTETKIKFGLNTQLQLLTIIFIALKIAKVSDIEWIVVFTPLGVSVVIQFLDFMYKYFKYRSVMKNKIQSELIKIRDKK